MRADPLADSVWPLGTAGGDCRAGSIPDIGCSVFRHRRNSSRGWRLGRGLDRDYRANMEKKTEVCTGHSDADLGKRYEYSREQLAVVKAMIKTIADKSTGVVDY